MIFVLGLLHGTNPFDLATSLHVIDMTPVRGEMSADSVVW